MTNLPAPIALCLEDLDATTESRRYLQCVALAGGKPGLVLDDRGVAQWCPAIAGAVELWVSADDCLILFRAAGAIPVTVHRAGRSLDAPVERPVVLLDQDRIDLGGRRLRIHVHGVALAVAPPAWLDVSEPSSPTVHRAAAAAVAVGVAVAGAGCDDPGVTQPRPEPSVTAATDTASASQSTSGAPTADPTSEAAADPSATASTQPDASATATTSSTTAPSATKTKPIQVRVRPPKPAMPPKDKGF
ncbi:MAG: hypothetical protein JRI68_28790 [Deltaproteobacteria bacterium]|nr:hypothetical protein [Deltaproteobacteria bacterium]